MSSSGSVTELIDRVKAGDAEAARELWELYWPRLLGLARKKLPPIGLGDEEDVVLSALASFFRGAPDGKFPLTKNRTDLWKILVVITSRKIVDLITRDRRQPAGIPDGADEIPDPRPSTEFHLTLKELLDSLDDPKYGSGDPPLRFVAWSKLEGYTNEQIAAMSDCTVRTIERKLRLIRSIWTETFRIEDAP
jgi:DNA-directed RNA polymerase specialized sigma24 family protein